MVLVNSKFSLVFLVLNHTPACAEFIYERSNNVMYCLGSYHFKKCRTVCAVSLNVGCFFAKSLWRKHNQMTEFGPVYRHSHEMFLRCGCLVPVFSFRFKIVGNELQKAQAANYETQKSHSVTVVMKDDGTPSLNVSSQFNIQSGAWFTQGRGRICMLLEVTLQALAVMPKSVWPHEAGSCNKFSVSFEPFHPWVSHFSARGTPLSELFGRAMSLGKWLQSSPL